MTSPHEEAVKQHLMAAGWRQGRDPQVMVKDVATAIGTRQASAWMSDMPDQEGNRSLFGHYVSEGRNVLAPCRTLVGDGWQPSRVASAVESFAADAEKAIASSYAVALHHDSGPTL